MMKHVVVAVAAMLVLGSCVTARLNQFHSFSQAGVAYSKANELFLDEAGSAAIQGDSTILLKTRADLTADQRRAQIVATNKLLRERLKLLQQLKAHGRMLRDYFEILGALADSKAPETLSAAAQGTADSLLKLGVDLKAARIGGTSVGSALPGVIKLVVASFKVKALEKELTARAPAIERELAIQEAALTLLSQELATDLAVSLNTQESNEVNTPFISGADIPKDWTVRRQTILSAINASQNTGAAASAARKMRDSFQKLVSNQLTDLTSTFADISAVASLIQPAVRP